MKKTILLFVIAFSFNFILAQQKKPATSNQGPDQTWPGIFAGPNLNYLDYYNKVTTIEGTNAGFHAGIFLQKKVNKYFALQPALLFSIRGGKIKNIDSTMNASLVNIELPINFLYL